MEKPILIDEIIEADIRVCYLFDGRWYRAKPLPTYSIHMILHRLYHAWLVLIGKATAITYKEDQYKQHR